MSLFKPNQIEEIKPGLFVQPNNKGKYRQVFPIVKDVTKPFGKGNINWKNLFRIDWQTIILIILIIFLLVTYLHDLNQMKNIFSNQCIKGCASECLSSNLSNFSINYTQMLEQDSINDNKSTNFERG